jgi:hypothetical protein
MSGYEKQDIHFSTVGWFFVWVTVGAVIVHLASGLMIHLFRPAGIKPGISPSAEARTHHLPPEPRLQVNPAEDLAALHRAEQEQLDSYGWINPEQGIVHIPEAQALKRLLERGLPVRPGSKETPS